MVILIIYPFSFPGTFGALLAFNRYNVIIFLEKFESIYDNISLKVGIKVRRVPEYCKDDMAREVRGYDAWKTRNWDGLKTEMLKEWRKEDTEQLMYDTWKTRNWDGLKTEILKEWRKEDTE